MPVRRQFRLRACGKSFRESLSAQQHQNFAGGGGVKTPSVASDHFEPTCGLSPWHTAHPGPLLGI